MSKQNEIQEKFIEKGLKFLKKNKKGYFDLAMRFGKCRTTIEILKNLVPSHSTILIAYPDNKLKATWQTECETWEYTNPNITYVNFSSLKKHVTHIFDVFIIDELHSCSENEREYAHQIMDNCEFTIGLSGTITSDTAELWDMEEIASYSTDDGIKAGILADYKITVHVVNLDNKIYTKDSKGKLKTEKQRYDAYTWVIEKLKKEGRDFMFLALSRNRLSQSSIGKLHYVQALLEKLKDKRVLVFTGLSKAADSIGIPSYHTKSKNDDAFVAFQNEEINHLALAAMGKVGVTYPHLDSVILTNFTYNAEESSQILNRAIKLDYPGKMADLHILCLNEKPELKKVKESLSMLDESKISYIFG